MNYTVHLRCGDTVAVFAKHFSTGAVWLEFTGTHPESGLTVAVAAFRADAVDYVTGGGCVKGEK